MQGLDNAYDCANDFFDMYQKEALEHYFGYVEDINDILRDDYVEEYEEWEEVKEESDNRKKVYSKKSSESDSSSSSSSSSGPKKRKVIKKRVV